MTAASSRALRSMLDSLASGDLDISSARGAIRKAIATGADMMDRAYTALRDAAWRSIAARDTSEDLPQWYDLQMHAAALTRDAGRPDLAERLTTLAELLAQSGRFADRQPIDEVLERKHVGALLFELASHGGTARRALLAEATGLADANLSRVLAMLSVHGLTRRARSGKEAVISLTGPGHIAVARLGGHVQACAPGEFAWWDEVDFPVAIWNDNGEAMGSNTAFRALVERAGGVGASALDYDSWCDWLSRSMRDEQSSLRRNARELQLADHLWIDYIESRLADGRRMAILADVTAEQQYFAKLSKQILAGDQQIAKLRKELARMEAKTAEAEVRAEEAERRLMTFTMAVDQLRRELIGGTAILGKQLRSCIEARQVGRFQKALGLADQQVNAIKHAMQYFMAAPGHVLPEVRPHKELVDPTKLVREQIDLVGFFHKPSIEILGLHDLPRVRAYPKALRAAIGQAIMAHIRETDGNNFIVTTTMRDNKFVFLMISHPVGGRAHEWGYEEFRNASSEDVIFGCGYATSRDWATSVGGDLFAGEIDDRTFVKMEFPVGTAAGTARAQIAGD